LVRPHGRHLGLERTRVHQSWFGKLVRRADLTQKRSETRGAGTTPASLALHRVSRPHRPLLALLARTARLRLRTRLFCSLSRAVSSAVQNRGFTRRDSLYACTFSAFRSRQHREASAIQTQHHECKPSRIRALGGNASDSFEPPHFRQTFTRHSRLRWWTHVWVQHPLRPGNARPSPPNTQLKWPSHVVGAIPLPRIPTRRVRSVDRASTLASTT
jgi:hypothetical protein